METTMSHRITRRQRLAAGGASAAALTSSDAQTRRQVSGGPGRAPFWEPGPNKNLVRDLKPGLAPIRIAKALAIEVTLPTLRETHADWTLEEKERLRHIMQESISDRRPADTSGIKRG
jgi:hypothetical protein